MQANSITNWLFGVFSQRGKLVWLLTIGTLALLDRLFLTVNFHFLLTDDDQLIMWHGLEDYAHGVFREPFFYGQDYNLMVEPFLAVPLLWLGIEHWVALPIVSMMLGLLPFFLIALVFARGQHWLSASLALGWPMLMPIEYGIISNLPRGHITGIALASISCLSLASPRTTWSAVLFAICLPLGFIACPNSLLLLALLSTYLLVCNRGKLRFYLIVGLGFFVGSIAFSSMKCFYVLHPEIVTHAPWNEYRLNWIFPAFQEGDVTAMLNNLLPIFANSANFVLPSILVLCLVHWFTDKKMALATFVSICAAILALGHSRVFDGSSDLFFSFSRHWLGLVVVICFSLTWALRNVELRLFLMPLLLLGFLSNVGYKSLQINEINEKYTSHRTSPVIKVFEVATLEKECIEIQRVCSKLNVDLVIPFDDVNPKSYPINRGCPLLVDNYPASITGLNDRLTWKLKENIQKKFKNVLLYNCRDSLEIPDSINWIRISTPKNAILIKNFNKTPLQLLDILGVPSFENRRSLLLNSMNQSQLP